MSAHIGYLIVFTEPADWLRLVTDWPCLVPGSGGDSGSLGEDSGSLGVSGSATFSDTAYVTFRAIRLCDSQRYRACGTALPYVFVTSVCECAHWYFIYFCLVCLVQYHYS